MKGSITGYPQNCKLLRRWLCTLLLAAPLGVASTLSANGQVEIQPIQTQKTQTEKEILALKQKVGNAQLQLKTFNAQASTHERALAKAEKNLSTSQREERQLTDALSRLQKDMRRTQKEIAEAEAALSQHKKWVEQQLQSTYKHGQDSSLKLVLSGQSASDTARLLRYHQALHASRQNRINEIERQTVHLNGLQTKQLEDQSDLKNKQLQLVKVKTQQEQLRVKLKKAHNIAQQSAKTTGQSISKMHTQTKMLEALLADILLQEELEQAKARSNFSKLRGDLKLPLAGKVMNTYNKAKSTGSGRWKGIWITPEKAGNNDVLSIAEGHIVFADWLLGYGLITIIDHGQGFFSLYGQTQALLKQPGDWVDADMPIALLNTHDMRTQPIKGLYFELRQNNDTLNPITWLQKNR